MHFLKKISKEYQKKELKEHHNRDFYLFVLEHGDFVVYITDSFGKNWSKVTRWVIEGFNEDKLKIETLSTRPFSTAEVFDNGNISELKYIFTNILYEKRYIGRSGQSRAIYEVFNQYSNGSLSLSRDIPVESILKNTFVLSKNEGESVVLSLKESSIKQIMELI